MLDKCSFNVIIYYSRVITKLFCMFQFDEEMLNAVLQEVSAMNEFSCHSDCSEIKGLEHRLFKLAQMMEESKRLAAEQFNLAEVNFILF